MKCVGIVVDLREYGNLALHQMLITNRVLTKGLGPPSFVVAI